jgi:hypothetical protein
VRPTLSFRDQSVLFRRPFALALRAKTSPPVTVRYRLVTDDARGDTNGWCHVNGNRLTLEEPPNLSLPVTCVVEASVPPASGLVPPRPVRAALQVNPPPLQISVPDRQVQWTAASGGVVSLRILEDTGNAYSMDVSSDNEDQCNVEGVSPAFPAPAGTTEFVAKVTVQNPDGASYQCGFTATAGPQDIFHDVEPYPFTVTIVP